jgi:VWFA-related protein
LEHEEAPVSLGILVDDSHSMRFRLRSFGDLYAAVAAFLQVANPDDEFFSMSFDSRPQLLTGFTGDREEILRSLSSAQLQGKTALRDGIYLAIDKMREARHPKRALLIISDGADTTSRYSKREVTRLMREADVQIYCLRVVVPPGQTGRTTSELEAPFLLGEVASWTGGRHFEAANVDELPYLAAKIGVELRHQYALTYVPAKQASNEWRKVEVKLGKIEGLSPMQAHFRRGYYVSHLTSSVLGDPGDSRSSP